MGYFGDFQVAVVTTGYLYDADRCGRNVGSAGRPAHVFVAAVLKCSFHLLNGLLVGCTREEQDGRPTAKLFRRKFCVLSAAHHGRRSLPRSLVIRKFSVYRLPTRVLSAFCHGDLHGLFKL